MLAFNVICVMCPYILSIDYLHLTCNERPFVQITTNYNVNLILDALESWTKKKNSRSNWAPKIEMHVNDIFFLFLSFRYFSIFTLRFVNRFKLCNYVEREINHRLVYDGSFNRVLSFYMNFLYKHCRRLTTFPVHD